MSDGTLYEKILFSNEDKNFDVRVVLSEFKGNEYLHVRKYFQSYEGDYLPSKEGISIPASLVNVYKLLDILIELCAMHESIEAINTHFSTRLKELNDRKD
jgi:hypothetical protein